MLCSVFRGALYPESSCAPASTPVRGRELSSVAILGPSLDS